MNMGIKKIKLIALVLGAALTLLLLFQNCGQPRSQAGSLLSSSSSTSTPTNGNQPPTGSSTTAPLAPTQFSLSSVSSRQINLLWVDNSTNETGFKIERAFSNASPFTPATGPGEFSVIFTTATNATSYADSSLNASTQYYYRITAVNSAGASPISVILNARTQDPAVGSPIAPSGVMAISVAPSLVNISWTDNSTNETSFRVERSSNNGVTFTTVASLSPNSGLFQDFNLIESTSYTYRVKAVNAVGESVSAVNSNVTTLPAGNKASYSYVGTNIIGPNCVACHGTLVSIRGLNYSTYAGTIGSVTPGNFNASRLYQVIADGSMPPGAPLTADQLNSLRLWISAGAPNN